MYTSAQTHNLKSETTKIPLLRRKNNVRTPALYFYQIPLFLFLFKGIRRRKTNHQSWSGFTYFIISRFYTALSLSLEREIERERKQVTGWCGDRVDHTIAIRHIYTIESRWLLFLWSYPCVCVNAIQCEREEERKRKAKKRCFEKRNSDRKWSHNTRKANNVDRDEQQFYYTKTWLFFSRVKDVGVLRCVFEFI